MNATVHRMQKDVLRSEIVDFIFNYRDSHQRYGHTINENALSALNRLATGNSKTCPVALTFVDRLIDEVLLVIFAS